MKRFPLRRLRIPVGAGSMSMVVPDERAWLRDGTGATRPPRTGREPGWEPPYWMRIWPASVAMARVLSRCGGLGGFTALDLGCGLGLPGVMAASLGARVHFVDRSVEALAFARWNAEQQRGDEQIAATELDWATATLEQRHDLVLLSDVSYHSVHHDALERNVESSLAEGGCVLHADPMRDAAGRFLARLGARYGFAQGCRETAFQDRRACVRLTLMAVDAAALSCWRERLGFDAAVTVAEAAAPRSGGAVADGGGRGTP